MFIDTADSSTNNKFFLTALLELRNATQEHQEPPIALMHGTETERVLRETMLRIRQDQQAAAETAKKRKAADNNDSDAPESENLGDEDSKEETTLQEDMDRMSDFMIKDESGFSMKLLQGVAIKALFSFQEHRQKPKHEQSEALDLLDNI